MHRPDAGAALHFPNRSLRDAISAQTPVAALIGNPNTGKTTLFNALTGFRRHSANYPGVTVEVVEGPIRGADPPMNLLDLPGAYSLAAASPDEMILVDSAAGGGPDRPRPDLVIAIVDASNLSRNCYLLSQVLELGLPVVVALNMIDVARARGIEIDTDELTRRLGAPVIPIVATQPATLPPLVAAVASALHKSAGARSDGASATPGPVQLPVALQDARDELVAAHRDWLVPAQALRVLVDRDGHAESQFAARGGDRALLAALRAKLDTDEADLATVEVQARYAWVRGLLDGVVRRPTGPATTATERIDRFVTHPLLGSALLVAILLTLFQAIFSWAGPLMDWIDGGFGWVGEQLAERMGDGWFASLLVDGIVAGVGGVLVFLPQILILFAFIAVLEDCGYLARAAFMMDRLMRGVGLSGRAFIPLLSSFACAIPAIMGTRTIADRRERFATIMLAPFMSCSARLPVYVLMISAFVPAMDLAGGWLGLQTLVMMAMYAVGVVVAIPISWLLRRSVLAGPPGGFVMELPGYKTPRLRAIWHRVYFAGRGFLVRAGTIILLVNLVVWALAYFPRSESVAQEVASRAQVEGWDEARSEQELAGAYLRSSYLGRAGHAIEPAIRPLGWDWRIGVAVIASFPAREVVVATLGTIYNLDAGDDESGQAALREALVEARWAGSDRRVFTLPVALSIMVFFALCAQCSSTLVIIGRETGSWGWPVASFVGMTTLAYFAAWGVSAAATALGW